MNRFCSRFFTDDQILPDAIEVFKRDFISPRPSLFCSDYSFWSNKSCLNDSTYFSNKNEPLFTDSRHCATYMFEIEGRDVIANLKYNTNGKGEWTI